MTAPTQQPDVGWDVVRLAEATPKALSERASAELERAQQHQPLLSDLTSARSKAVTHSANNRARLERLADHVLPGDTVVEIGCGEGYVATRLLEADAGRYSAMDIVPEHAAVTRAVLEEQGLTDRIGTIAEKDLYDLTAEDLAGTSLVVCSEVIEHVPDPEAALEAIGRALPDDAELLFSVPLLNKLEKVWGHLSIFTADRLVGMLERAELEAHHVEPFVGQWVLVLAGPRGGAGPRSAERLAQVRAAAEHLPAVDVPEDFTPVPPQPTRFDNVRLTSLEVAPFVPEPKVTLTPATDDRRVIDIDVTAGPEPATAGTTISLAQVGPVEGLRLGFEIPDVTQVTEVAVTFRRPDGRSVGRWAWTPKDKDRAQRAVSHTASLRPGAHRPPFTGPKQATVPEADRVEITVTVAGGGQARLRLTRASWIR